MDWSAPIERDDDIVTPPRHLHGMLPQQQAGREKCDPAIPPLQKPTKCPQIAVQQRLAAGKHDALYPKPAEDVEMSLQVLGGDLALLGVRLPDVAHHAPAVAPAMWHEYDYGQRMDFVGGKRPLSLYQLEGRDHGGPPAPAEAPVPPCIIRLRIRVVGAGMSKSWVTHQGGPEIAGIKLAYIGGGSTRAPGTVSSFIDQGQNFAGSELVLIDLNAERLETVEILARKLVAGAELDLRVAATTDRRAGLTDCDAVLTSFRPGGFEARFLDASLPLRHGVLGQ